MIFNIFCDASVNHDLKVSIGCYIIIGDTTSHVFSDYNVSTTRFETVKSTEAEQMTILKAIQNLHNLITIEHLDASDIIINIYTDCDGFINVINKSKKHKLLYKEIMDYVELYKVNGIKMQGHTKQENIVTNEQKIFRDLDKHVRKLSRGLKN